MSRKRLMWRMSRGAARAALPALVAVATLSAWATDYTSASYVQDGLIAQWDGIDNAGTGTHDPNATVWKDLKGTNDLTIVAGRGSEWRRGIAFYMNTRAIGLAATPLTTAGGVTVIPDADESVQSYAVVPSKLVIDASAFDAERKGRKQTLISCAVDSTESLQRLVDNVEFVNAARHGAVTIEDDGTRLVYYGLSGRTIVVVR